jgi:hypothetical protein
MKSIRDCDKKVNNDNPEPVDQECVLQKMNESFALDRATGRVLWWDADDPKAAPRLIGIPHFKHLVANVLYEETDPAGCRHRVPVHRAWLQWPGRREIDCRKREAA